MRILLSYPLSTDQGLSSFRVHINHLGSLLKMQILIPRDQGKGLKFCISNKLQVNAEAAGTRRPHFE